MQSQASGPARNTLAGAFTGPRQSPRVVWMEVPEELRHVFEPYLLRELPILPRWVVELRIRFSDTSGDAALTCQVAAEYRTGWITLRAGWFTGDEHYRRSSIRHELTHFALDALNTFAERVIDLAAPADGFRQHLRDELRRTLEMATTDVEEMLTAAIGQIDGDLTGPG